MRLDLVFGSNFYFDVLICDVLMLTLQTPRLYRFTHVAMEIVGSLHFCLVITDECEVVVQMSLVTQNSCPHYHDNYVVIATNVEIRTLSLIRQQHRCMH
ncbi:hypothetical protein BpHYR1_029402 [Brachionus plicatilis]|uniref:Uncharacterized protein n=1 Tax=Brachionus plicatilis TaxID=10195 RepID=A0A3M7Q8F7_BRAPC|nr:hypothetical protein BpHYR1_029402 [Brachionus plicatilis]